MQTWMIFPYFVLWATLVQGVLVSAKVLPPSCARCGLRFERRRMGERVCRCHTAD